MRKQFILFFLFFLSISFFWAGPVQAHRVNVFAWVEGNTIYTTAKFSGGKVARESRVKVYDTQKKLLLEGQTDRHGTFSFPVPKIDNLEIVVEAGTGHRGSWKIKKEELTAAQPETSGNNDATPPTSKHPAAELHPQQTETGTAETASAGAPGLTVNSEKLESIVRKVVNRSLNEKLHPLLLMLAEIRDPDPGLKDILGGLGYIFGLVGIIAYIKSRKQLSAGNKNLNS